MEACSRQKVREDYLISIFIRLLDPARRSRMDHTKVFSREKPTPFTVTTNTVLHHINIIDLVYNELELLLLLSTSSKLEVD